MKVKLKPAPEDTFIDFWDEDDEGIYWLYEEPDGTQFLVFESKI